MPMFQVWANDSRGQDKRVTDEIASSVKLLAPSAPGAACDTTDAPRPAKRRRPSAVSAVDAHYSEHSSQAKSARTNQYNSLPSPASASADGGEHKAISTESAFFCDMEKVTDIIQHQFGLEILLKHDELRLINQELAKCQIALEQLKRCHLIPYPSDCPTPDQMLDISSGMGPALPGRSGKGVPKWAPPFGVVDGPYARHYAKWLIPDPVFDGVVPEPQFGSESRTQSAAPEGRSTRNGIIESLSSGRRPGRGNPSQRLQSLSSGYPQLKDKQSPCILKRSDGQTVKLVCVDCHRWDFSSTQGFINHCRIAHRRDYKSHDEAAFHCGQPIVRDGAGDVAGEDKPTNSMSGLVQPFARNEDIEKQETYAALRSRIRACYDLVKTGQHPCMKSVPGRAISTSAPLPMAASSDFVGSSETPYLTSLMNKKKCNGDLCQQVTEAKKKVDLDEISSAEDDVEEEVVISFDVAQKHPVGVARVPAARVPMRSGTLSTGQGPAASPTNGNGLNLAGLDTSSFRSCEHPTNLLQRDEAETSAYDDEMGVDFSPNTVASHNAPSLVSDDGEFDDSEDGSCSESSLELDKESVSDVAEIMEDNDDTPRPIHHREPTRTTVQLKKDEGKHVTFVSPCAG